MNQDVSNGAIPESGITDDDIPFKPFSKIKVAFVPPKPKLLLNILLTSFSYFSRTQLENPAAPSSRFSILAEPTETLFHHYQAKKLIS